MPFDENKFRVSVETGGIDTVSELGLPIDLLIFGTLRETDFNNPGWSNQTRKDFQIKDLLHHIYIQAPAGASEARSAVTRYLGGNKTMSGDYIAHYINCVTDEGTWSDIGRCIYLYHEVLTSVRKPYRSKWYKKEIRDNEDLVKYTWVNVLEGVEPKRLYGKEQMKDLRLAVGLSADEHVMFWCIGAICDWKSHDQHSDEMFRTNVRFSFLFEELMKVSCHPKRYFNNCINANDM